MSLEGLVTKYVRNTERVLTQMRIIENPVTIDQEKIKGVIETAKRYLEGAKYYREEEKLETNLAAVAYCEGLLDALRFLGMVEFSW
jgi:FAD synthetase